MTREIKFRAWDGKKMLPPFDLIDMYVHQNFGMDSNDDFQKLQSLQLMQYTGLKDKNGKEIYEGDVVGYGKEKAPHEVRWDDVHGMWMWRTFKFSHTALDKLEVIGNIYENPELLK
jgi:uncharacterized phage protein (TIGR01671 family)